MQKKKPLKKCFNFAPGPIFLSDTCLLCCLEGSRDRSLSHGHFAGLYYWLIAFKLSPLRAFLLSGDCLLGLERTRLALATQICCTLLLSHVACNLLSLCTNFIIKHSLWHWHYLIQKWKKLQKKRLIKSFFWSASYYMFLALLCL